MTYNDGSVYTGDWIEGKAEGKGKISFKDKSSYDGEWKGGEYNGQGIWMKKVDSEE